MVYKMMSLPSCTVPLHTADLMVSPMLTPRRSTTLLSTLPYTMHPHWCRYHTFRLHTSQYMSPQQILQCCIDLLGTQLYMWLLSTPTTNHSTRLDTVSTMTTPPY